MKHLIRKQLTNIVFLILIVAAALTIYLLSRNAPTQTPAAATPSFDAPSPTPGASAAAQQRGIPESVFVTHLQTSTLYTAKQSDGDPRRWTLTYGDEPSITVPVIYTVENGSIATLELTFPLLGTYKEKSKSEIEQYLYDASQKQAGLLADAMHALMSDLFPVCDAEDRLSPTSARYWAEQSLALKKTGEDFEDKQTGCRFLGYRIAGSEHDQLVCAMFLE